MLDEVELGSSISGPSRQATLPLPAPHCSPGSQAISVNRQLMRKSRSQACRVSKRKQQIAGSAMLRIGVAAACSIIDSAQ